MEPPQYSINPSLNIQNEPSDHELFISKLIQQKLKNKYSQSFPAIAITFDLPTIETEDFLRMRDEHFDTIPKTESDEFIKYSIENLVQIDSLLDEFASELILLKSIPQGIDETDCDLEEEIVLSKNCCMINHLLVYRKDLFLKILMLQSNLSIHLQSPNDSLSLPENESFHFDIPSFPRPPAKPPDDDSGILTVKMVGDISKHDVPMPRLLPTQPTLISNQEKSPHLLSHRGLKASQLYFESPMMIYGGNTPILDVPFLYFYPP
uniref:Reverse transcriptase domain-containing protein n=1 Tax=Tanacetum cinerariifolium TaxID=118510 RepID=A0A699JPQ9_TANCI|nr:hypothetical protein [Tanacetum cinerariifolium]